MRIFIGFDARQPLAYTVCRSSIERYAKGRVQIEALDIERLPISRRGLTAFTFTRYLVPWLCNYQGTALFMDADMVARADVGELLQMAKFYIPVSLVKGVRRFEWSSLMIFNNDLCRNLTPEYIDDPANSPQAFAWASEVGELPREWNHCVGYDEPRTDPKIIHYTAGIPAFKETQHCEHAAAFTEELRYATSSVGWEELMGRSVHREMVLHE